MENSVETYRGFDVAISTAILADGRWSIAVAIRPLTVEAIAAAAPRTKFGSDTVFKGPIATGVAKELKDARHFIDVLIDGIN